MNTSSCEVIKKTKGLRLYGVCEPVEMCREEACRYYDVRGYASIDEVLSDGHVDASVIATPNESHAPLTLRCLEAGKHVILEKSMCLSIAEADALIISSHRQRRLVIVRHNRRRDRDYLAVKRIIEEGHMGQVFVLDSSLSAPIRPSN
jgi:scyllo-inositol 2-dehydrogenase (NADP+)